MKKVSVGIAGGAGYTGGELIRLLIHHPYVSINFVNSRSNAGKAISSIHHDLVGETDLVFCNDITNDVDVLFLCLGHGESRKFLGEKQLHKNVKLIDLSQDFRLSGNAVFEDRSFVYGLPELNNDAISTANNIANPGCFATALQLGLLPLAKAGLLNEVYSTGITGSTGAGQSLSATSHFSWRANNIQSYKTLNHQHIAEVTQSLNINGASSSIHFVPWRGDFTRGIFVSSTVTCDESIDYLYKLYEDFYKDAAFTLVNRNEIHLKQVVNTNKCVIHLEKVGSKVVIHSAVDNLLKGASGQAVQNMNLMFGFDEKTGLNLKANAF